MNFDTNVKERADAEVNRGSSSASRGGGPDVLALIAAAGLGATAMYFLDPARGRRRRHLVQDKLVHAAHVAADAAEVTTHDVANHARGLAAVARRRFTSDEADDIVISERVRAELGRLVSHPGAILVSVEDGQVTLGGDVLASEAAALISGVGDVRGVTGVVDRLARHDAPENVPALQGQTSPASSRFELLQENWTPTARLLTTATGAALTAIALREGQRRNPLLSLLGLAGFALALRGATNAPYERILGASGEKVRNAVKKPLNMATTPAASDALTAAAG